MRNPCLAGLALVVSLSLLLAACGSSSTTPVFEGHEAYFTANSYEGTESCLECHEGDATEVMASGHWNWEGTSTGLDGKETETHGKTDLINNFCIAIASNEGRCTQCHVGYGWVDDTFDFTDMTKVDCLVCHDTTGLYAKAKPNGGLPTTTTEDLQLVAQAVGSPRRNNCGFCHYKAGGGDNVKHGDLSTDMNDPLFASDVHMATLGLNFTCQRCHTVMDHKIAGMPVHSQDEGTVACTDCHSATVHADAGASAQYDSHAAKVACQTCHIPTFARVLPTKTLWDWSEAGMDVDPIPVDQYGKPLYDKMKGVFEWGKFVEPALRWYDGKWARLTVGDDDQRAGSLVTLGEPTATRMTPGAKIYPFKRMVGTQMRDKGNNTMLVPHLFGTAGGPTPYWGNWDWDAALVEGAAKAGQTYTGNFEWVDTEMFLTVNHEIAPKEDARTCSDCHGGGIDFTALGYSGDPIGGLKR